MAWFVIKPEENDIMHHGRKGQKWGVRNGPPYPLDQISQKSYKSAPLTKTSSPEELNQWFQKNMKYSEFTKLKSPEEVARTKSGSCHDQVMLELSELKSMGYNPKATFLIEYNDSGQGGTTHSFVTYQKDSKTIWFENAWGGQEGLHEFGSLDDIKKRITNLHKSGKMGDYKQFDKLEFADFGNHVPGEDLQELVDKCLD